MAKRIAQYVFNKFFSDFIELYNDCFGKYTSHLRNNVLPDFRKIHSIFECHFTGSYFIVNNKALFHSLSNEFHILTISPNNKCFIDGKEYFNIVNGQKQSISSNDILWIKQHIASVQTLDNIDRYMIMMLESFEDPKLLDLLKTKNDELITNINYFEKCPIFVHFELRKIWGLPADPKKGKAAKEAKADDDSKDVIWKYWLGCYCIAKSTKLIPNQVLDSIEKEAIANSKTMSTSNSINLGSMKRTGKELLQHLNNDDIFALYDYLTEVCLSDYTPLFNLVPQTYHATVKNVQAMWSDESIRLTIVEQIKPVLQDMKRHSKEKGIRVIDDDDDNNDNNNTDQKFNNNGKSIMEDENVRTTAIEYYIDLCLAVVERKQDLINQIAKNPTTAKDFIKNTPNILSVVSSISQEFKEVMKNANPEKFMQEQRQKQIQDNESKQPKTTIISKNENLNNKAQYNNNNNTFTTQNLNNSIPFSSTLSSSSSSTSSLSSSFVQPPNIYPTYYGGPNNNTNNNNNSSQRHNVYIGEDDEDFNIN